MAAPAAQGEGAGALRVTVLSPEQTVYQGPADSLVVPAYNGQLGILRGHAPMMALLGEGELRITVAGADRRPRWRRTGTLPAGPGARTLGAAAMPPEHRRPQAVWLGGEDVVRPRRDDDPGSLGELRLELPARPAGVAGEDAAAAGGDLAVLDEADVAEDELRGRLRIYEIGEREH